MKALSKLEKLKLEGCVGLNDDSVQALAALPALRQVDLKGSAVTEKGLAALKTAKPGIQVYFGPWVAKRPTFETTELVQSVKVKSPRPNKGGASRARSAFPSTFDTFLFLRSWMESLRLGSFAASRPISHHTNANRRGRPLLAVVLGHPRSGSAGFEAKIGLPSEHVSHRPRQHPVPGDPRGVGRVGRTSHRSGVHRARRHHLLSGMFHSRLPVNAKAGAATRPGVPRTRLVRHRSGRREGSR